MSRPPRADWRLTRRAVAARPRLLAAVGMGVAVDLALIAFTRLSVSTSLILGWDALCLVFLVSVGAMMIRQSPHEIAARAAAQDEGQGLVLVFTLVAAGASLAAVAAELIQARGAHGLEHGLRVGLGLATTAGSWLVIQTVLALHYAHEYYLPDAEGQRAGGLAFPGDEPPDYWDFLHFAVVIGVAAQTADIAITDRRLRRLATVHSVIAFAFNTLIIALAMNLVAGLF